MVVASQDIALPTLVLLLKSTSLLLSKLTMQLDTLFQPLWYVSLRHQPEMDNSGGELHLDRQYPSAIRTIQFVMLDGISNDRSCIFNVRPEVYSILKKLYICGRRLPTRPGISSSRPQMQCGGISLNRGFMLQLLDIDSITIPPVGWPSANTLFFMLSLICPRDAPKGLILKAPMYELVITLLLLC